MKPNVGKPLTIKPHLPPPPEPTNPHPKPASKKPNPAAKPAAGKSEAKGNRHATDLSKRKPR